MSLSNSDSDGVLSMDIVKSSILNEEMRRMSPNSSSQSEVLVSRSRGETRTDIQWLNYVMKIITACSHGTLGN
ncbi:hypothetical protein A2U01_0045892 [Trifolium medium]|uniref:Uncharacterized protein n=1 Tax=Trifolium medium TaxID=97028 RepID=A0A392QME7_9FABA|nr:hypothetical protein [Trifolium medium]